MIKWIDQNYPIGRVYAAWGTNIEKREYLVDECQHIVDSIHSEQWFVRGITKNGHPKHPLYVPYEEKMEWFPVQDYLWSFEWWEYANGTQVGINNGDHLGEIGDFVIVPAGKDNHEAVVEVVKKEYFSENEVPLPLDRTKHIIRKS